MTEGQKTGLLIGGGLVALYLVMSAKPRTTLPPAGYQTGTGGTAVALAGIAGGVSVIDSITNAIVGQQTQAAPDSSFMGF